MRKVIHAVGVALVLAITASAAHADTVLYATGFEPPTFAPGLLAGQDGWSEFPVTSAAVQVENVFSNGGTQAVDVVPSIAASAGVTQDGAVKTVNTSAPIVRQSADIWLSSSTNQSGWQYAALGPGLVGFAGGIDISNSGTISLITSGSPQVGTWSLNQWVHVDLTLNYATQLYDFAINGTVVGHNVAFCGDNGPCTSGVPVTAYANGFFDTFPANAANDIGFLDNYSVSSVSPTPLPAALPLFATGLGVLGLVARRRKQKQLAA